MIRMRAALTTVAEVVGIGLVSVGFGLIGLPFGLIAGGLGLVVIGVASA